MNAQVLERVALSGAVPVFAKVGVEGSNPFARSTETTVLLGSGPTGRIAETRRAPERTVNRRPKLLQIYSTRSRRVPHA